MNRYKIKYTPNELPKYMWAIGHYWLCGQKKRVTFEITDYTANFKEEYLLLFNTQEEAQEYINEANKQYNIHPDGEKIFWFKNRENIPIKINTTLKKYKSKYMPIEYALSGMYR